MKRLALLLAVLSLGACQSGAALGTPCTRSSECSAPLVCEGGRCRAECVETRDCPIGAECLPVGGGIGACALTEDRCTRDDDCTAPLVCGADGACRAACLSDADCTSDGRCVLAGRLVCVAGTPSTPPPCTGDTNAQFVDGLDGWCIETSGVDASVVSPVVAGVDMHAARIDLANAPVGAWVRLYQELPPPGAESWVFDRPRAALDGAIEMLAIEMLDEHGVILGRVARTTLADGTSDCSETGHPTAACGGGAEPTTVAMSATGASGVEYANVDLRRVASVRRVVELVRTGTGAAELVVDGIGTYGPACPYGWWRNVSLDRIASFDLDHPAAPPIGFTPNDAPIRAFSVAECGIALGLDGTQSIDWTGSLPDVYTVSFAWHGAFRLSSLDGVSFVHEIGGGAGVSVVGNQVVVHDCAGAIAFADPTAIGNADARFQEMQLMVDRAARRICLARSGHLVMCAAAPACAGAAPTGLRFGETAAPLGDTMALDEIRIDRGVQLPDGSRPATQHCALDLSCQESMRFEVRDTGSGACVPTTSCIDTFLCPSMATSGIPCSGTLPTLHCTLDASCPLGLRECGAASCVGLRPEECMQPFACL